MKYVLPLATAVALLALPAAAQTTNPTAPPIAPPNTPAAQTAPIAPSATPGTPATTTVTTPVAPSATQTPPAANTQAAPTDANAPLPGANSFTEAQARSRIEQLGYTSVTGLAKDSDGVWRGKATKNGQAQDVAVDYRGNIVVGQK